jgi:hypothetical protein
MEDDRERDREGGRAGEEGNYAIITNGDYSEASRLALTVGLKLGGVRK